MTLLRKQKQIVPREYQTFKNYLLQGCYDALKDFANKYSIAFICVGVFILLVEVRINDKRNFKKKGRYKAFLNDIIQTKVNIIL